MSLLTRRLLGRQEKDEFNGGVLNYSFEKWTPLDTPGFYVWDDWQALSKNTYSFPFPETNASEGNYCVTVYPNPSLPTTPGLDLSFSFTQKNIAIDIRKTPYLCLDMRREQSDGLPRMIEVSVSLFTADYNYELGSAIRYFNSEYTNGWESYYVNMGLTYGDFILTGGILIIKFNCDASRMGIKTSLDNVRFRRSPRANSSAL